MAEIAKKRSFPALPGVEIWFAGQTKKNREMNQLRGALSQYWLNIQGSLFPWLKEELGELTEKQQQLVMTLELVRLEEFLHMTYGLPGRPPTDRTRRVKILMQLRANFIIPG